MIDEGGGDDSPNPSDQDRPAQEAPDLGIQQNSAGGAGGDSALEGKENPSPTLKALVVEGTSPKVSYSDVLLDGSSGLEDYPEFVVKDGVAEVEVPMSLMEEAVPLWNSFVVGYFMNDAPHIGSIHATVNRIWASPLKKTKIDVQFIGKTTVLFRIEDAGIRNRILKRKFWHISDVPLMLGEWTPETARSPPDLSAMPLWVDMMNVPGYLYSKKGLSFLSRTTGKFIKLHPNTEHCVRLDVARVLVEVDLTKPLPTKINFKGRDGSDVVVSVTYPWLPPRCLSCSKWGHVEKDCSVPKANVEAARQAHVVIEQALVTANDSVVLEGFSTKDTTGKSPSEIVTKLMEDLESMTGKASLSGEGTSKEEVVQTVSNNILAPDSNSWSLVPGQGSPQAYPRKAQNSSNDCISPNGFQALQDIREEGEIEDDEETGEVEVPDSATLIVESLPVVVVTNETSVTAQRHGGSQRNKGRGAKRGIVNSRDLVQAVTQQQKANSQVRKASSRKH